MTSTVSPKKIKLITSKLTPARVYSSTLFRKDLIHQFDIKNTEQSIILVTAPAGYGKSSFLGQCYESCKKKHAVTWLNLEKIDNDPTQFLQYLIASFQELDLSLGERAQGMLSQTEETPYQLILESLLDDITDLKENIFLFVDDIHFIDEKSVLDILQRFLEAIPKNLSIVLACRYRPSLPFVTLKTEGKLIEFDQKNLGFSLLETQNLLTQIKKINLSPEDCKKLFLKTEGWPAAIQLVSIALEQSKDKHHFIETFSGNDRDITDFLGETVLSQLSKDLKKFLYQISILDRISNGLATHVSKSPRVNQWIEEIEEKELFFIPLDRQRQWFRFHHLFKDFLMKRFEQDYPDLFYEAHERATEWFENQGFMDEAIEFALRSHNFKKAAELMSSYAIEAVSTLGKHITWLRWSSLLPEACLDVYPLVRLFYSQALQMDHQYLKCQEEYLKVGEYIKKNRDPAHRGSYFDLKNYELIRSIYEAMMAYRLFAMDLLEDSRQKAEEWLQEWPDVKTAYSGGMQCILSMVHNVYGDFEKAQYHILASMKTAEDIKSYYGMIWTHIILGITYFDQGILKEAQKQYELCLKCLEEDAYYPFYCLPMVNIYLAKVYYEKGDLDSVKKLMPKKLDSLSSLPYIQIAIHYWEIYFQLLKHDKKFQEIENKLKELEVVGDEKSWPRLRYWAQSERISLYLDKGEIDLALKLVKKSGLLSEGFSSLPQGTKDVVKDISALTKIRIFLARNQFKEALSLIFDRLQKLSHKKKSRDYFLSKIWKIYCLKQLGREHEALRDLKGVLINAADQGFIQIFLDEGRSLGDLFEKILQFKDDIPQINNNLFFEKIIKGLKISPESKPENLQSSNANDSIMMDEPASLTKREQEILQFLDSDDTVKEVAEKLFVSQNTLKTHLRNLYSKMSVKNRSGLMKKAKDLNLI